MDRAIHNHSWLSYHIQYRNMAGTWKMVITVLLLQVVISYSANSKSEVFGRYLKREERGSPSKLRFTSGSYGFYNASIKESSLQSTIKCDMKMGIYIYDARTQIIFEVDDKKRFSVRSHKIEDFVFLRIVPNMVLNSDTRSVYTINVVALDSRTREEIDHTRVYLQVLDINEFKPSFSKKMIEISIKENLKVGDVVLREKAFDRDSGLNGALYYFIPPNEVLSVGEFSLHPHTGTLSLVKPLDFNRRKSYEFHIIARDKCPNEKRRTQSEPLLVKIHIIDVPNYPLDGQRRGKREDNFDPMKGNSFSFMKSVYTVSVAEISPPFTPLIRVEWKQPLLSKGMTSVNFFQGNEQGRFEINSKTGQIYTVQELDYEKTKSYNLTVVASYKSHIIGRTSVIINVLDSNDHSPTFPGLEDEVNVFEETPIGTTVYTAKATDGDTGVNKQIFYSIGNMNETYFDIDWFTGDVRVAKRLDRDGERTVPPIIYLLIKASDFGVPVKMEGRMILKIKINDFNDNRPVLQYSRCMVKVARNARLGSPVLGFKALDIDRISDPLFFAISGDVLRIEHSIGSVRLNSIPQDTKQRRLVITATDGKLFSKNLNLTFVVVPARKGRQIEVSCVDNAEFTTSLATVSKRESHEKSHTVETFGQIKIPQRKPHRPFILEKPDTVITLREDLPVGSFVTKVVAVDKELKCYGLVLYSIVSGSNNVDSNFAIDMLNGSVYLAAKLDREQMPSYNLRIRAWDTDRPAKYTDVDVQIDIIDVNDNGPVFKQKKYEVGVPENTPPGGIILRVQAKDPDRGPNGMVTYSLVDLNDEFSVDKYTGVIKLNKMLDYERRKRYVLTVQAEDGSSQNQQISQASVVINVKDINDTPPTCIPKIQTFEVTRDFPSGAVLGKISSYDPDTGDGGKVEYAFAKAKAQRLLHLDSEYGILRTTLSTMSHLVDNLVYNVTIIVRDKGAPVLSTSCNIVLVLKSSLSSERPKFLRLMDENLVVAEIDKPENIVTLEATLEGFGEMEYSLVDGTGIGEFTIDSQSGKISRSNIELKGGSKDKKVSASHYWLTVNAHLKKHLEVYSNIAVLLRETNRTKVAPYFDPTVYRVSVQENLPRNTEVVQLSVVSQNSGSGSANLVYKFVDGNDLGHFQVNTEGMVITTQSLDREQVDVYQLNISVFTPDLPEEITYASVLVSVEDVNDNDPELDQAEMTFQSLYVLEQKAVTKGNGTFLSQIVAVDRDIGSNAELVYQLIESDSIIDIDPKTGVLSTKAQLNRGDFFIAYVKICDKGGRCSHQDAYREVIVEGKPKHDLRMLKFKQPVFTYHLGESTEKVLKPTIIVNLATLLTSGQKSGEHLIFSIQSGNEDNKFAIRTIEFAVNLCQVSELDFETKREHDIEIKVTNGQTSDTAILKIKVKDLNDNAPKTSQSCYQAEAIENVDAGMVVTKIEGEFIFHFSFSFKVHFHKMDRI